MDKQRENRLSMAGRVRDLLKEHAADLTVSEVAAQQAADVRAGYDAALGARGNTAKRTRTLTKEGRATRNTLRRLLPALQGPLARVASRLNDGALLASATLTTKSIQRLRPAGLLSVTQVLLTAAARADVAPELARQGLTAATLQPLQLAFETYKEAQPKPRRTIDERVVAGEKLESLVDALMQEIYALDEDMKAFALLNPELLAAYEQARVIVDVGARGDAAVTP